MNDGSPEPQEALLGEEGTNTENFFALFGHCYYGFFACLFLQLLTITARLFCFLLSPSRGTLPPSSPRGPFASSPSSAAPPA